MTGAVAGIDAAREAYLARDWPGALAVFEAADAAAGLDAADRYALANCHWWLGDLAAALPVMERAFDQHLATGLRTDAAMVALDVGYTHALRGDESRGSGWIARATRLLADEPEGAAHGYLEHLAFERALDRGRLADAAAAAHRARELGERHADPTLTALGVLGEGVTAVRSGRLAEGLPLLDEAMVAAVSDDLDPGWAGNIYCHLMAVCDAIGDLRRAREWTDATARWCDTMPSAGPFLGICRVHRAQVLQVRGAWDAAVDEIERVRDELSELDVAIAAEACRVLGDLHRLRGHLDAADRAYRECHRLGGDPQPGLAALRLAQGDLETAASAIRTALATVGDDPLRRARLLPTAVDVALALGELDRADELCQEFVAAGRRYDTAGFATAAALADGQVLLARGDHDAAATSLRAAVRAGQELDAPFEVARARALLADAHDAVGDREVATLERDAARAAFAALGAVDPTPRRRRRTREDGLTDRELQILRTVATGRSNQDIADDLVLSVRTVERHLATIYQKLGLHGHSARAAAVAYALREGLLPRP